MADVYGERIGQDLDDEEWLRDAGGRGWVVLMKDTKIRYRPAELQALADQKVRAFCLTKGNLSGREQAERFTSNLSHICRVAQTPGPYIYGVYADRVKLIWPVDT